MVLVPVHAPLHPANVAPDKGVAVRVTLIPAMNDALQLLPQLIPAGLLVTKPLPLPPSDTVNKGFVVVDRVNVAVTVLALDKVT